MLPSLTRRPLTSPVAALWDMQRDMDRLFNGLTTNVETPGWTVPAEVYETDNEFRFVLELPGMHGDDLDVTVENNVLTISGERKHEREEGTKGEYHVFERRYGRFERSFALPRRVDADRIDATYENGLLTVALPKTEEAKPRRIEVRAHKSRQIESR